jgi:hypothetical protein
VRVGAVAAAEVSRADPVNRGTLPGLEKRQTWGTRGKLSPAVKQPHRSRSERKLGFA